MRTETPCEVCGSKLYYKEYSLKNQTNELFCSDCGAKQDTNVVNTLLPLTNLASKIHNIAIDKGWWDTPQSFGETVALCHSELSEALEEYRSNKPFIYYKEGESETYQPNGNVTLNKPEGIAVEMADCIIRILDWCGHAGINIDEIVATKIKYNTTRSHKHGGKIL